MEYQYLFHGQLNQLSTQKLSTSEQVVLNHYLPEEFLSHELVNRSKDIRIGYIIRGDMNLYTVVFYLTNNPTIPYQHETLEDAIKEVYNELAMIEFIVDNTDKDLNIRWVSVNLESRGRNYAKYLIILSVLYTQIINPDISLVKLEDMSDNKVGEYETEKEKKVAESKNLYRQLGFKYENEGTPEPEMIGDINKILELEFGPMTRAKKRKRETYFPKVGYRKKKKKKKQTKKEKKKKKTKKEKKKKKKQTKKTN